MFGFISQIRKQIGTSRQRLLWDALQIVGGYREKRNQEDTKVGCVTCVLCCSPNAVRALKTEGDLIRSA